METISFEEFKKMDIMTAKILSAEEHPNADKLYVLRVSIGTEERQLVAGIRQQYPQKEVLVGKNIVVITNLQPRTIRGVESCGMLLAAHDENDGISVLTCDRDVSPGSEVS